MYPPRCRTNSCSGPKASRRTPECSPSAPTTAPMSLYSHVNGKDELLMSMMDSVLGEDPLPTRPPKGWRAQLELCSRMQWQ
jgi:hypothetical protein